MCFAMCWSPWRIILNSIIIISWSSTWWWMLFMAIRSYYFWISICIVFWCRLIFCTWTNLNMSSIVLWCFWCSRTRLKDKIKKLIFFFWIVSVEVYSYWDMSCFGESRSLFDWILSYCLSRKSSIGFFRGATLRPRCGDWFLLKERWGDWFLLTGRWGDRFLFGGRWVGRLLFSRRCGAWFANLGGKYGAVDGFTWPPNKRARSATLNPPPGITELNHNKRYLL